VAGWDAGDVAGWDAGPVVGSVVGLMNGLAGFVVGGSAADPMGGSGSGWMYGAGAGLVAGTTGSGTGWTNGAGAVAGADWAWASAQTEPAISAAIAAVAANKPHAAIHVHLTISATPCTRFGLQISDSRFQTSDFRLITTPAR
jgi:hypothetical protein